LFCPQKYLLFALEIRNIHIICAAFQAQIIWPARRFWGQIYAQADEHKEDIYADNQCSTITKA
jgi:hypothetical protein